MAAQTIIFNECFWEYAGNTASLFRAQKWDDFCLWLTLKRIMHSGQNPYLSNPAMKIEKSDNI